jgi:hypothetical protein
MQSAFIRFISFPFHLRAGDLSGIAANPFFVGPPSQCSVLSPSFLARLENFVHVARWPDLETVAIRQAGCWPISCTA